jgi:hypothetical protein
MPCLPEVPSMLVNYGINIDNLMERIKSDCTKSVINKFHVSILLASTGEVLSYGINKHLCDGEKIGHSKFSLHSEVNCVVNYYFKPVLNENTTTLLVMKLSKKIQKLGNSKPCAACKVFISNNQSKINLSRVIYSTQAGFEETNDIISLDSKVSSGDRPTLRNPIYIKNADE